MNILLIGNGFDLAHGLPTRYKDFLDLVSYLMYLDKTLPNTNDENEYKKLARNMSKYINKDSAIIDLIKNGEIEINFMNRGIMAYVTDNILIDFFLNKINPKENWIDFEKELSLIIQSIDADIKNSKGDLNSNIVKVSNVTLHNIVGGDKKVGEMSNKYNNYLALRDKLIDDLNRLIRALELYLVQYINKLEIKKELYDIDRICDYIDRILSFNYTETFQKIYQKNRVVECDYIHGKAIYNSTDNINNMVLGIDEYLSDEKKNTELDFIYFKKYFQRIHKETGCKYLKWVQDIKLSNSNHNLYIFGHSLDVTDKDVLRSLILNDNVYTTVFYRNKEQHEQQIINLVKVIGQDELIRRTGGDKGLIKFVKQHDSYII